MWESWCIWSKWSITEIYTKSSLFLIEILVKKKHDDRLLQFMNESIFREIFFILLIFFLLYNISDWPGWPALLIWDETDRQILHEKSVGRISFDNNRLKLKLLMRTFLNNKCSHQNSLLHTYICVMHYRLTNRTPLKISAS